MTNDNFANAELVTITTSGGTYTSAQTDNMGYSIESGEPGLYGRSAWWQYTPLSSGTATLDTETSVDLGSGIDTWLGVYTGSAVNALTEIAVDDDSGASGFSSKITGLAVTAGVTYRIRVSAYLQRDIGYKLRVVGPATTGTAVAAVPIDVTVAGVTPVQAEPPAMEVTVDAPIVGVSFPVQSPAIEVTVEVSAAIPLVVPPIDVTTSIPSPSLIRVYRELVDPIDDTIVPVIRPVFTVTVSTIEGDVQTVTIEVQYDDNTSFTSPVTLSSSVDLMHGYNVIALAATADVAEGSAQYWRARLIFGGSAKGWTAYQVFTVDASPVLSEIPVTWDIQASVPPPHLWFVTPPRGAPGDLVTVVGQGFPVSSGSVSLAGSSMAVNSWTHVAASGNATAAGRVISPGVNALSMVVDPEHDEIVVVVPDSSPPGGALVVSE